MRVLEVIARWLFILCLPLLLLTAAFRIPGNIPYMYEYLFNKYNVGVTTGLDSAGLRAAAEGMVKYFNSNEEYIDLIVIKNGQPFQLFNEREIIHLKDVKGLFQFDMHVLWGTLAFALAYVAFTLLRNKRSPRDLAKSAFMGGIVTLALMAVIGVGMLFNFDSLLLEFHLLSFANDFWLLDPTRDYLIMLITHGFMYDASFIVAGATAVGAFIVGGAGGGYLLYARRGNPTPVEHSHSAQ